jgi:uncharacterized coiled-coil protein SlyX
MTMPAKAPSPRPRTQKVVRKLDLTPGAASGAAAKPGDRRDLPGDARLGAEIQRVEARISARMQANEEALADMQRLAGDLLNQDFRGDCSIRTEMLRLEARVAGRLKANEKVMTDLQLAVAEALHCAGMAATDPRLHTELRQMDVRLTTRFAETDQRLNEVAERLERLAQSEPAAAGDARYLESAVEGIRRQVSELHNLTAEDLLNFESSLRTQAAAIDTLRAAVAQQAASIDSTRTAMSQTDDLVERMVEALESVQSSLFDHAHGEERTRSVG